MPTAASARIIERPFRPFLEPVFVLTFYLPKAAILVAQPAALPAVRYPFYLMSSFYNTCPARVSLLRFGSFHPCSRPKNLKYISGAFEALYVQLQAEEKDEIFTNLKKRRYLNSALDRDLFKGVVHFS